jgi:hypothetical protein
LKALIRVLTLVTALAQAWFAIGAEGYQPQAGDLIFQISGSEQAQVVRLVTGGTYGHVGIVFIIDGVPRILEAGGASVHYTSLDGFIKRTDDKHYVVKRLKHAELLLTPDKLAELRTRGEEFLSTGYDKVFNWSDEEMYCSELAWKLYERVFDVELGRLAVIGDFDLTHPRAQKLLQERYGDDVPLDETVISPTTLFASDLLEVVYEGASG